VAIFGLFGKKTGQPTASGKETPRSEGRGRASVLPTHSPSTLQRNADLAHATARKIDAIESEMSSEFTTTQAANSTLPNPTSVLPPPVFPSFSVENTTPQQLGKSFEATLPIMGMSTELLLGEEGKSGTIEVAAAGGAQVYEEAAILFANNQIDMAEQLLRDAIAQEGKVGNTSRTTWWMLFDLYQVTGKHEAFDNLSLDYTRLFEMSPPPWRDIAPMEGQASKSTRGPSRPTIIFSGKLDNSVTKTLERALKQAENHPILRLEFSKITDVDPVGCGLLLRLLKRLQKTEHGFILVDADQLMKKVRAILQVGRKNETEVPWLLLMEVLRLLNKEKEFEEVSMDYCVTFEVSPPSFTATNSKVTTLAQDGNPTLELDSDKVTMPAVVEGKAESVLKAMQEFAKQHDHVVVDCEPLHRIDFSAAGQLLSGLGKLRAENKSVEFQQVNHLVATLFQVMGYKDLVTVQPRKY
jgi:ABC-type transporter Mla MlaB component